MTDKKKFPRADALKVARQICLALADHCVRLVCAGSLRRRKEQVGDVEILYIPEFTSEPDGLFDRKLINKVDVVLERFIAEGVLTRRKNVKGSEIWGGKNKLAVHISSEIKVDFFSATETNWFNYLVCRTGGAQNNVEIATAAQAIGWKWNPYGPGFTDRDGQIVRVKSEREVFECAGLDYLEPWERS